MGYVRVSTEEKADSGLGLATQRAAAAAEAERRGWTVAAVYEDTLSGKNLDRPGLVIPIPAGSGCPTSPGGKCGAAPGGRPRIRRCGNLTVWEEPSERVVFGQCSRSFCIPYTPSRWGPTNKGMTLPHFGRRLPESRLLSSGQRPGSTRFVHVRNHDHRTWGHDVAALFGGTEEVSS